MAVYRLSQIAESIGGKIFPEGYDIEISGISGIDDAGPSELTFVSNRKYYKRLKSTKAAAVLSQSPLSDEIGLPCIVIDNAYYALRGVMIMFYGERADYECKISPNAVIGRNFKGDKIHIGDFVVVGDNVNIGNGSVISGQVYIGDDVTIGENCLIHPGVKIMKGTSIGDNVVIHPGAVIGSDGFGFALKGPVRYKIPQVGRVVIEDDVEIGANSTIDRATMGKTIIKRGTKIDNLVHIAHNVIVGEDCAFAAQVGISGSCKIGDRVILAGQVGLAGHIELGDNVIIAAQSGVPNDVPSNSVRFGYPARDIRKQRRIEAIISKLPEYINRLRALEKGNPK